MCGNWHFENQLKVLSQNFETLSGYFEDEFQQKKTRVTLTSSFKIWKLPNIGQDQL
jgi:hypothetical protein